MRRLRQWGARGEGQAVVELALALPILILVALGMAQLGLMLNAKQTLEGVAAQSARAYAITGDARRAIEVLRIAGEPLEGFAARSTVSLTVSAQQQRTVVQQIPREVCQTISGFRRRQQTCRTLFDVATSTQVSEVTSLAVSGPLGGLQAPAAARGDQRGQWVTVSVTYLFPNPVRPTFFQLPATFPLTTRAVARVEQPPAGEDR